MKYRVSWEDADRADRILWWSIRGLVIVVVLSFIATMLVPNFLKIGPLGLFVWLLLVSGPLLLIVWFAYQAKRRIS